MFFEAEDYLRLRDRVAAAGCDIAILPGIMPVTNVAQIQRFAVLSGADVPGSTGRSADRGRRRRRGGSRDRRRGRDGAVRAAARRGCAGPALHHPQPIDVLARDLPTAGPRRARDEVAVPGGAVGVVVLLGLVLSPVAAAASARHRGSRRPRVGHAAGSAAPGGAAAAAHGLRRLPSWLGLGRGLRRHRSQTGPGAPRGPDGHREHRQARHPADPAAPAARPAHRGRARAGHPDDRAERQRRGQRPVGRRRRSSRGQPVRREARPAPDPPARGRKMGPDADLGDRPGHVGAQPVRSLVLAVDELAAASPGG